MAFEHYISEGKNRLRCGYTTGACAALAAQAAARLLLTGTAPKHATLMTPKGIRVVAPVLAPSLIGDTAYCFVRKDGGDDIDATDGALIGAAVRRIPDGIQIDGGDGVGTVTKPGLDQPVGAAAINTTPRRMIARAMRDAGESLGYTGGFQVIVSAPEGETIARRTFNPSLGIVGGISILGTTGIVEPRSLTALRDCLAVEVRFHATAGNRRLIITPGNYGAAFLHGFSLPKSIPQVQCANFIGDTLDFCAEHNFLEVLLVGHIGKLVKIAGGIMNTHSRTADCRAELFTAHAALCGANRAAVQALMESATSDACLEVLDRHGLRRPVLESIASAVQSHLNSRAAGAFRVGAVLFTNTTGFLVATEQAVTLQREWSICPPRESSMG